MFLKAPSCLWSWPQRNATISSPGGASDMAGSATTLRGANRQFVFLLLAVIVVCGTLLAAFRVGVDRGFPGAIGTQTWGRILFAIGAAETQMDHGGYGYTLSTVIETILTYGGLTADPK